MVNKNLVFLQGVYVIFKKNWYLKYCFKPVKKSRFYVNQKYL